MTEREVWNRIQETPEVLSPVTLEVVEMEPCIGDVRPDALIRARWGTRVFDFVAKAKALSTPKAFETAIDCARRYSDMTSLMPFIILPYLRPSQVKQLAGLGISGMDLSGNGVLNVKDEVFFYRTGIPERSWDGSKRYNAYRGASSLVGRALLARPSYPSVSAVQEEIAQRGGAITQSTVSKSLKEMEEDLILSRGNQLSREGDFSNRRPVTLLQPDRLLDRLASEYNPPRVQERLQGKTGMDADTLQKVVVEQAKTFSIRVAVSGLSSSSRYSVMAREPRLVLYCSRSNPIVQGVPLERNSRFPDLELRVTDDPLVYFDVRKDGVPWASPVQTYLELKRGDPREQETANQVRDGILAKLADQLRADQFS